MWSWRSISINLDGMDDKGLIFDIKRDASEDGPGIRTTVFFKGCPLSCVWCQNPEGIDPNPGLASDGSPVGYWVTVDELLYRIAIDRPFYDSSGGGVTLSGGEATLQMGFIHRLLQKLRHEGIKTALETCGFFKFETFEKQVLPYLDIIYFDLKLIDVQASRRYTGQSNRPVLENFSRLRAQSRVPVIPRIPLVPGITTTADNLSGLADFLQRQGASVCTLLRYNPLWRGKLESLGQSPRYQCHRFMTRREEERCARYFRQAL